jgi:plasmid stability protein
MPTITIRNLPDKVLKSLKEIARRNRNSMEQEVRNIITCHVMDKSTAMNVIESMWNNHLKKVKREEAVD